MTTLCPSSRNASAGLDNDVPEEEGLRRQGADALKAALRRGLLQLAVPFQRWLQIRGDGGFGILMYHRVFPRVRGVPQPTWNVTPEKFRRQLTGLLQRGFRAWPLQKVLRYQRECRPIPAKVFVVTFDDGYANNFHCAWPVLRELQVPATIFLATGYLGRDEPFPFDDWAAAGSGKVPPESWKPLTIVQCRRLQESGLIELGAHTHTHGDFRRRPAAFRDDMQRCLAELRLHFGIERPSFAFPYGTKHLGFSGPPLSDVAEQLGLLCSLTTESERVTPGTSPFDWGRFTAEGTDTAGTLAVKLTGGWQRMRHWWRRGKPAAADTLPDTLANRPNSLSQSASASIEEPAGEEGGEGAMVAASGFRSSGGKTERSGGDE